MCRLNTTPGKESAVLAIYKSHVDRIITLYHSRIFAGHQGVIKMYLTINERFFIPDSILYFQGHIRECHICQL